MQDINFIRHYLSLEGIRVTVADITSATKEAMEIHTLSPMEGVVLGKTLLSAALLATDFKNHEGVSLKWETNGDLGTIHSDAYEGHLVRGFIDSAKPVMELYSQEREVALLKNKGRLFVTRYSLLKLPYVSTIDLAEGTVEESVEKYVKESDQTLSAVGMTVSFDEYGQPDALYGYMAQLLPGGNQELFHKLFNETLKEEIFEALNERTNDEFILKNNHFGLLGENTLKFQCTCSEQRIRNSLEGLPKSEKESLLEDESIEVNCHYCGKKYKISRETLTKWFNESEGGRVQ